LGVLEMVLYFCISGGRKNPIEAVQSVRLVIGLVQIRKDGLELLE